VRELAAALKTQFFIATHSPLLMAYPGAARDSFARAPAQRMAYDTLEPVILTRNFPNTRGMFLRRLFDDDS
jgi:predicted ATPase